MEKLAEDLFDNSMTAREHAIFEVGIKLASIFHFLIGIPIKNDPTVIRDICEGLKAAISCQPFVKRVDVQIVPPTGTFGKKYVKAHEFDYTYISGKNLIAECEVQYEDWIAIGRVEWISDLDYPLMYVKEVKQQQ